MIGFESLDNEAFAKIELFPNLPSEESRKYCKPVTLKSNDMTIDDITEDLPLD